MVQQINVETIHIFICSDETKKKLWEELTPGWVGWPGGPASPGFPGIPGTPSNPGGPGNPWKVFIEIWLVTPGVLVVQSTLCCHCRVHFYTDPFVLNKSDPCISVSSSVSLDSWTYLPAFKASWSSVSLSSWRTLNHKHKCKKYIFYRKDLLYTPIKVFRLLLKMCYITLQSWWTESILK